MANTNQHKSALSEQDGIQQPDYLSKSAAERIRKHRKKQKSVSELAAAILKGDKVALSQGITLIESQQSTHQEKAKQLIEACLSHVKPSIRIGITGVPGVGKSTFIEAFGTSLISKGYKVAVLAVDPSSGVTHGSILGDKTRMEDLVKEDNAFIRPSPSGDSLGGVARKTRESIILCEAAGFDVILIETVGVGQSETTVHSMTDFFLLLKLAGAGDELQGIKRGIIEMADAIVINKADGENIKAAKQAKSEFRKALHLYPEKESQWQPKVLLASALKQEGISEVWEMIEDYKTSTKASNYFEFRRQEQNKFWLLQTIQDRLKADFFSKPNIKTALQEQLKAIEDHKTTAFEAASYLLNLK